MEEAALNLGASKFHIFRTVTLPLLVPGLAGSFLLLFVESLADLGNPLLLGGNATVLSTEIFLAVNGQYDQQKGAALSLVLLIPTLTVFLLQRYVVGKRSYVAVTGKPTGRPTHRQRTVDSLELYHGDHVDALLDFGPLYFDSGGVIHHAVGHQLHAGSVALCHGADARIERDSLHHLPLRRGDADCRAGGHDCGLYGGAQKFLRQRDAGLCLEPGRGRAGDDPGHRLHYRLYQRAGGGGGVGLCAVGGLLGRECRAALAYTGRHSCRGHSGGLLFQLAALFAGRRRKRLALAAGGYIRGAGRCG